MSRPASPLDNGIGRTRPILSSRGSQGVASNLSSGASPRSRPDSSRSFQRALNRSESDLSQRPSHSVYEFRPQIQPGCHTGQLVATSPKRGGKGKEATAKPSKAEQLLADVDSDVKAAAKKYRSGEPREAIQLLQRAYRKAETADASSHAVMLARALVRLQLAGIYSGMAQRREALAEAASAMLEADAAWQAMLSDSAGPSSTSSTSEPPVPADALSALLKDPPPWLERTAEVSVLARCRAASELQAAAETAGGMQPGQGKVAGDEALREAGGLLKEAEMLSRHFLPDEHRACRALANALERLAIATEERDSISQPSVTFSASAPSLMMDASPALAGLSDSQKGSLKAAQDSQLPAISSVQSRKRLPPSREGQLSATASPPASAQGSVSFQMEQEPEVFAPTPLDDYEEEEDPFPPEGSPVPRRQPPAPPPVAWTGRVPAGDVYISSVPKAKLPRMGGKKKKVPKEVSEADKKMLEEEQEPPPNAFQDWLGSFDDPLRNDVKRILMKDPAAGVRFKTSLKEKSCRFKKREMGEISQDELYMDRIHFCGYGMRATKIAEKQQAAWDKKNGWGGETEEAAFKNATRHDLFKYYKVDLPKPTIRIKGKEVETGKSTEPTMRHLGKLLQESEPGKDRSTKKINKQASQAQGLSLFGSPKKEEPPPVTDLGALGAGISKSMKKSSTAVENVKCPDKF